MKLTSARLISLEASLNDLLTWKKLGLVPKAEEQSHEDEIVRLKEAIEEEKLTLKMAREEGGDAAAYILNLKRKAKPVYQDSVSVTDVAVDESRFDVDDISQTASSYSEDESHSAIEESESPEKSEGGSAEHMPQRNSRWARLAQMAEENDEEE